MAIIPTVEVFKGDKRMICNEADADGWKAQGWSLKKAPEKVEEPASEPTPEKAPEPAEDQAKVSKKKK